MIQFYAKPAFAGQVIQRGETYIGYKAPGSRAPAKWSNVKPVPPLGARAHVTVDGLGMGTVVGYFRHHGFLGILVSLDSPPDEFVERNGGNVPATIFGSEVLL